MFSGASGEVLSKEGEAHQVVGRASLDIFSPVREGQTSVTQLVLVPSHAELLSSISVSDSHSGASSHRKTPLVTPLGSSSSRCYSPLSVFQTPQPIKEEEPHLTEPCNARKVQRHESM